MPGTTLDNFDPEDSGEMTVDKDPAEDITLEDMGEDKELNTPPETEGPDQEEPEEDKPEEAPPEEKPVEKKEPGAEKKPTAEQAAEKAAEDKAIDEILNGADKDGPLRVKGKEYSAKDFTKEELRSYIQRGIRMTQIGTDLSKQARLVTERERQAEANALEATRLVSQYRPASPAGKVETEPPKELQPSEYDTDDVKAVKQVAVTMWKENQSQAQRLNTIEGGIQSQQTEAKTREFLDDLTSHKTDFPLASTEEVIAVHALRPDIPLADLVRRSHAIYGSIEHVKEVFKHAPEVRKAVEDELIAAYLARNSKARVIPQKPSTQGVRSVPAAKAKITSMDSAGQAAKKAFARMIQGHEDDNE